MSDVGEIATPDETELQPFNLEDAQGTLSAGLFDAITHLLEYQMAVKRSYGDKSPLESPDKGTAYIPGLYFNLEIPGEEIRRCLVTLAVGTGVDTDGKAKANHYVNLNYKDVPKDGFNEDEEKSREPYPGNQVEYWATQVVAASGVNNPLIEDPNTLSYYGKPKSSDRLVSLSNNQATIKQVSAEIAQFESFGHPQPLVTLN